MCNLLIIIFAEQVWGAGNAAYPGTHAKYVVVSSKEVQYFLCFISLCWFAEFLVVICTFYVAC